YSFFMMSHRTVPSSMLQAILFDGDWNVATVSSGDGVGLAEGDCVPPDSDPVGAGPGVSAAPASFAFESPSSGPGVCVGPAATGSEESAEFPKTVMPRNVPIASAKPATTAMIAQAVPFGVPDPPLSSLLAAPPPEAPPADPPT